jgi:hypothetical protein
MVRMSRRGSPKGFPSRMLRSLDLVAELEQFGHYLRLLLGFRQFAEVLDDVLCPVETICC